MAKKGFKGGGMPNMGNMMKQAQKMQKEMKKKQEEIEGKELEISAGGGAIKLIINGKKEVLSMEIDESVVDPEDVEMLQDLIIAAVNEGIRKAEEMMNKEMEQITGNLGMPGML